VTKLFFRSRPAAVGCTETVIELFRLRLRSLSAVNEYTRVL